MCGAFDTFLKDSVDVAVLGTWAIELDILNVEVPKMLSVLTADDLKCLLLRENLTSSQPK